MLNTRRRLYFSTHKSHVYKGEAKGHHHEAAIRQRNPHFLSCQTTQISLDIPPTNLVS